MPSSGQKNELKRTDLTLIGQSPKYVLTKMAETSCEVSLGHAPYILSKVT